MWPFPTQGHKDKIQCFTVGWIERVSCIDGVQALRARDPLDRGIARLPLRGDGLCLPDAVVRAQEGVERAHHRLLAPEGRRERLHDRLRVNYRWRGGGLGGPSGMSALQLFVGDTKQTIPDWILETKGRFPESLKSHPDRLVRLLKLLRISLCRLQPVGVT